jgi:altronate dehydratase small subunit
MEGEELEKVKRAIKLDEVDNVATSLGDVEAGDRLEIRVPGEETQFLTTKDAIPFGHKVALIDFMSNDPVFKYGAPIGIASCDISTGEHVHTHNLESARAVEHD